MSDNDMVTMVGPDGSVREVDRETAKAATALLADIETRITAAYKQGKEVGRINGAARLEEAQRELRRVQAIATAVQELALSSETLIDPRVLHQTIHDAYHGRPPEAAL